MNTWYYKHTTPHITVVSNHNVNRIKHTGTCAHTHTDICSHTRMHTHTHTCWTYCLYVCIVTHTQSQSQCIQHYTHMYMCISKQTYTHKQYVLHMQTHHQLRNGHNWGLVLSQADTVGCFAVPPSNERGTEEIKGWMMDEVASGGSTDWGNEQLPSCQRLRDWA